MPANRNFDFKVSTSFNYIGDSDPEWPIFEMVLEPGKAEPPSRNPQRIFGGDSASDPRGGIAKAFAAVFAPEGGTATYIRR